MINGGYIEGNVYHYYLTDHLGNNRVVVNASGTVIPKKHHYPFGTALAENTVDEQKQQPYKYNGKELDQMHGLNPGSIGASLGLIGTGDFGISGGVGYTYLLNKNVKPTKNRSYADIISNWITTLFLK